MRAKKTEPVTCFELIRKRGRMWFQTFNLEQRNMKKTCLQCLKGKCFKSVFCMFFLTCNIQRYQAMRWWFNGVLLWQAWWPKGVCSAVTGFFCLWWQVLYFLSWCSAVWEVRWLNGHDLTLRALIVQGWEIRWKLRNAFEFLFGISLTTLVYLSSPSVCAHFSLSGNLRPTCWTWNAGALCS